jgi:hypothetical protein
MSCCEARPRSTGDWQRERGRVVLIVARKLGRILRRRRTPLTARVPCRVMYASPLNPLQGGCGEQGRASRIIPDRAPLCPRNGSAPAPAVSGRCRSPVSRLRRLRGNPPSPVRPTLPDQTCDASPAQPAIGGVGSGGAQHGSSQGTLAHGQGRKSLAQNDPRPRVVGGRCVVHRMERPDSLGPLPNNCPICPFSTRTRYPRQTNNDALALEMARASLRAIPGQAMRWSASNRRA